MTKRTTVTFPPSSTRRLHLDGAPIVSRWLAVGKPPPPARSRRADG
jgi:hypothetical protein